MPIAFTHETHKKLFKTSETFVTEAIGEVKNNYLKQMLIDLKSKMEECKNNIMWEMQLLALIELLRDFHALLPANRYYLSYGQAPRLRETLEKIFSDVLKLKTDRRLYSSLYLDRHQIKHEDPVEQGLNEYIKEQEILLKQYLSKALSLNLTMKKSVVK